MVNPVTLLLLYGGKSGEHEISLQSAASVLANLNAAKYRIIPVAMDKQGQCHVHDYQALLTHKKALPVQTEQSRLLPSLIVNGRLAIEADVVFPMVHGPLYEDGCLQGLLQLANVAYVGSHVISSAISMDKDITRRLACGKDLHCARYKTLSWFSNTEQKKQFCETVAKEFGWPLFVKPLTLGSSVGIHKALNMQELLNGVEDALRYDETVMVEEFINGREIELAVLENSLPAAKPHVSVAGEICIHHPDGFYSYRAKYLESEMTDLILPAKLEGNLLARLQEASAEVFTRLKCRGMARVDFFVGKEDGKIYLNEINTLPGFTTISMYPKLWAASGMAYPDLLDALVTLALTHQHCKNHLVTDYL